MFKKPARICSSWGIQLCGERYEQKDVLQHHKDAKAIPADRRRLLPQRPPVEIMMLALQNLQ
jgi:hypothetical protein